MRNRRISDLINNGELAMNKSYSYTMVRKIDNCKLAKLWLMLDEKGSIIFRARKWGKARLLVDNPVSEDTLIRELNCEVKSLLK